MQQQNTIIRLEKRMAGAARKVSSFSHTIERYNVEQGPPVTIVHAFNDAVQQALQQGGTVLLLPDTAAIKGHPLGAGYYAILLIRYLTVLS